jgi:excisionase family DNA binding protein
MNSSSVEQAISFSMEQAAAVTGLSRTRLYAAISAGDLRTFKAGRRRMVRAEQLKHFVEHLERVQWTDTRGSHL